MQNSPEPELTMKQWREIYPKELPEAFWEPVRLPPELFKK